MGNTLAFDDADLPTRIEELSEAELDGLDFGVIGFDADTVVRRYNATESQLAGLSPERVLGQMVFVSVAPCMNNFLVAQRFQDTAAEGSPLDVTIDYVLTFRMRPSRVKLRLVQSAALSLSYVLVQRLG